jgi:hypothetical protein
VPYVQRRVREGSASLSVENQNPEANRDARPILRDVLTDKALIDIVRPFLLLGGEHATRRLDSVLRGDDSGRLAAASDDQASGRCNEQPPARNQAKSR